MLEAYQRGLKPGLVTEPPVLKFYRHSLASRQCQKALKRKKMNLKASQLYYCPKNERCFYFYLISFQLLCGFTFL